MMNPQLKSFTLLHLIKAVSKELEAPCRPKTPFFDSSIVAVSTALPHDTAAILTSAGWSYINLNEASKALLEAIQSFLIQRIQEPAYTSLAGLNKRQREAYPSGTIVITQADILGKRCLGKIVDHASNRNLSHLGDCWLIQFKSGTCQYIPADLVYLASQFDVIPIC